MSVVAAPPKPPELPAWLQAFEHAQAHTAKVVRRLSEIDETSLDLRPIAANVADLMAHLYGAVDLRGDRLSGIREALGGIERVVRALAPSVEGVPTLGEVKQLLEAAREQLMISERHFAGVAAPLPPEPRPLRASDDTLNLHYVERPALRPYIRVPAAAPAPPLELPALAKPTNNAELHAALAKMDERAEQRDQAREDQAAAREAERAAERDAEARLALPAESLPEGFIAPIDPALSENDFVVRRTRDLFEEVAMVGSQRTPQLGDAWRNIRFLEKRMFAAVDALAALAGPAVQAIEELVVDSPVKDPTRGFAAIVLLGAIEGRDTLAAAERVIRFLGSEDPEVMHYAAQALKLVPHPHLALAMRGMLASSSALERALAVDVLAHRGLISVEELLRAAQDPAAEVAAVALPALARAAPHQAETGGLLVAAAGRPDVAAAAWLALALAGHPNARYEPVAALDSDEEEAALALALVADDSIASKLLERAKLQPSAALVTALGWAGAAFEAVPFLIDSLGHEDEALRVAAGHALDRLTGAQLYEEVEVDPEQIIVPDAPVPDMGELEEPAPRLANAVSDPRDVPSDGSPDTVQRASTDPAVWQDYWRQRYGAYKQGARYRRGHAYTPATSLWELDGWILSAPERRFLHHELIVRTGRCIPFDPLDFVQLQQEALKQWEPVAQAASNTAGGWSLPSRRR